MSTRSAGSVVIDRHLPFPFGGVCSSSGRRPRPRHARPRGGERVAGRNRETTTDEAGTVGFAALAAGGGRAAERDFRDAAAYRVVSCVADGTATATGRRYAMAGRA